MYKTRRDQNIVQKVVVRCSPRSSSYVLVVEDNEDIRLSLVEVLQGEGFAVRSASNGREGLAVLRTHGPAAVVLLDLMMPVMDGETFRQKQLAESSLKTIPVVVITATDRDLTHLRLAAVLRKPFEVHGLLELVGGLANRV